MTDSKKTYNFPRALMFGWVPWFAFSVLVLRGATIPGDDVPSIFSHFSDKLIHASEFFILTGLSWNAWRQAPLIYIYERRFLISLLYCSFIAVFTEWLQIFVPGRQADFLDIAANAAGILSSCLCIQFYFEKKLQPKELKP